MPPHPSSLQCPWYLPWPHALLPLSLVNWVFVTSLDSMDPCNLVPTGLSHPLPATRLIFQKYLKLPSLKPSNVPLYPQIRVKLLGISDITFMFSHLLAFPDLSLPWTTKPHSHAKFPIVPPVLPVSSQCKTLNICSCTLSPHLPLSPLSLCLWNVPFSLLYNRIDS